MLEPIVHGVILAFGLILPLGAQNVLVFNQGATQKPFIRTVPVVLVASLCDTLLISLAVLGVSVVVLTFAWLKLGIFMIGFLFLLYMGWSIWNSDPSSTDNNHRQMTIKQQILFAMSVSLLNPHAILDTIGVIGTSSLNYEGPQKLAFSLACIFVSWLWFLGLAVAGHVIGRIDTQGTCLRRLNKVSGIIIWGVGLYIGIQVMTSFEVNKLVSIVILFIINFAFIGLMIFLNAKANGKKMEKDIHLP
jgi:L-lysine exporter family protein LysE/ArgO